MSKLTPEMREAILAKLDFIPMDLTSENMHKVVVSTYLDDDTFLDMKVVQKYFPEYRRSIAKLTAHALTKYIEQLVTKMMSELSEEAPKPKNKSK